MTWMQEMVLDKSPDGIRPRFLIYDVMQFEVSVFTAPGQVHVCHGLIHHL